MKDGFLRIHAYKEDFQTVWSLLFEFLNPPLSLCIEAVSNLHSQQQRRRLPLSPWLLQHVLFVDFVLTAVRRYLIVVLICISLRIKSVNILSCTFFYFKDA